MTDNQCQPEGEYPHVPAAFINAIAEEGPKAEAVAWLQKQWNETCALRAELKAHRGSGVHTEQEPAAWWANCEKTGGQMVRTSGLKDMLIEEADRIYAEHGYVLRPLYAVLATPVGVQNWGGVPDREAFWLLERHDGKAWARYTSHSGVFVHSFTEDVWQAGRFQSERHAHEAWRLLDNSERGRWKPVEHMFINKVQDTSSLSSANRWTEQEITEAKAEAKVLHDYFHAGCQCEHPMIKCDNHGCRCTSCGQPRSALSSTERS